MTTVALVLAAYVAGSFSFGEFFTQWLYGESLQKLGSGSTGATNASRIGGKPFGMVISLLDIGRGAAVVLVARHWFNQDNKQLIPIVIAVVVGNCWSILLRLFAGNQSWRGGKGASTSYGAIGAMFPWLLLLAVVMILVFAITGYVSVSSLTSIYVGGLIMIGSSIHGAVPWAPTIAFLVLAAIITWRHSDNIKKLLAGKEDRRWPNPLWPRFYNRYILSSR